MPSVAVNPPKTPVTKGSNSIAAATVPNVCKMPGPPAPFVPTPLPNIGRSNLSPKGYTKTVKVEGKAVAIRGASFGSQGDIASKGTGGGLVSSNTHGPTKFVGPGSLDVKFEGKNVHLLGDPMLNNCGPSGSPANSATLAGVMHAPALAGTSKADLEKLAEECNKKVNHDEGYCDEKKKKDGPKGHECTTAGTKKHKCCEEAIKEYNRNNPESKLRSEVGFDENGKAISSEATDAARKAADKAYDAEKAKLMAKGMTPSDAAAALRKSKLWCKVAFEEGGGAFFADVLVVDPPGGTPDRSTIKKAYDFKFARKDEDPANTGKHMNDGQRTKYRDLTGQVPDVIHKDGRKC